MRYYPSCGNAYDVGKVLACVSYDTSDADLQEMEIVSKDSNVVLIIENRYLHFIADGVARVEVRPKYNLAIGRTFTFYVGNDVDDEDDIPGNGDQENNNQGNGNQTNAQKAKYYDKRTGVTISINSSGKKEATLVTADKKHAKGNLTVPNTLKVKGTSYKISVIGKNAFQNQKQLKKVVLGKNISKIEEGAFSGCEKLQTVIVGKNVTAIGKKAFYKCKNLSKITIPSKVNKIGDSAFYGCRRLKNITIQSKKLTNKNVGSMAFKGIYAKPVIKVPKSKFFAYKKLLRTKGAELR
ncbi:leucine-rich repeat domain-containing protein [Lachnospiraceae bacterium 45-W7]